MAQEIQLPNGEVALLVDRNLLATEFDTHAERASFFDKIRRKSTGKYYRRANALLYDYVPENKDVLVEVS